MYPEELGITARYRGSGLVAGLGAQDGNHEAHWVEGDLLVFNPGYAGNRFTGEAEIGFVWKLSPQRSKVGQTKQFLVLLNRIELD